MKGTTMREDRTFTGETPSSAAAVDPIVAAARQMVVDVFKTSAAQLPELLKAQTLPSSEIPAFTAELIGRMEIQLARALGQSADQTGDRNERG